MEGEVAVTAAEDRTLGGERVGKELLTPCNRSFRSLREPARRAFFIPIREPASPRPGSFRRQAGNSLREPVPAARGFPGLEGSCGDSGPGQASLPETSSLFRGPCGIGCRIGAPASIQPPGCSAIRGGEPRVPRGARPGAAKRRVQLLYLEPG